jgi:predicted nuclease of predicted toxin-antitoxin system
MPQDASTEKLQSPSEIGAKYLPAILVDENVPGNVREWLKLRGFSTVNISDTDLKGSEDTEIAEYAAKNGMTILTLDTDFAQIYHDSYKGKLGVIVVKAAPATSATILETVIAAQRRINMKEIQNKLVIVTKKKIRIIT